MKVTARILVLFIILIIPFKFYSQNTGFGLIVNSKYKNWETNKKITSIPFCNQKHFDKGNSTPNPFGIGIHSFYYNQNFFGTGLELVGEVEGSNAPIPVTIHVDSMYQNTSVMEFKTNIRPNIWLFPFLNIYGIFGYTAGQVNPNITVPYFYVEIVNEVDTLLYRVDTSFSITEKPVFHGPTVGAGLTLSVGFSRFFLIVDYNYSVSFPLQVDANLQSMLIAPKIGMLFGNSSSQIKAALWVGAMGYYNNQFFSGKLDIRDIDKDLEDITGRYIDYMGDVNAFKGEQWNFIFGGSWIFNPFNNLSLEFGVYPRMQATLSYNRSF
jgi:hypothetical protein